MKDALKTLDRFWFGYGSPVALGVFRALMASLIGINFLMMLPYWGDWFGERGYVPGWAGSRWLSPGTDLYGLFLPRWNPLIPIVDDRLALAIYIAIIMLAFLTAVGWRTRPSSILLAMGVVALHHRDPLILHGGDSVLRLGAIYLAVAPSGAAFSLDAIRRQRLGEGPPQPVSLWPQRLIQFNMALLYFTATWGKYFGTYWKNGLATWFPARLNEFKRFPVPGMFNDLPFVYVTTYGTLAVEFALAVLVWFRPLRKWVLLSGILLHGYIEYSMNIPLFSFLMMSLYVVWYDGDEVEGWWERTKSRIPALGRLFTPRGTVRAVESEPA